MASVTDSSDSHDVSANHSVTNDSATSGIRTSTTHIHVNLSNEDLPKIATPSRIDAGLEDRLLMDNDDEENVGEECANSSTSSIRSEQDCRICGDTECGGRLLTPCKCNGSISRVHAHCLEKWIRSRPFGSDPLQCEICHAPYGITLTRRLVCDLEHLMSCAALSHLAEGLILVTCVLVMFFITFYLSPRMSGSSSAADRSERSMLYLLFFITAFMSILALRKLYLRWHEASSVPVIL